MSAHMLDMAAVAMGMSAHMLATGFLASLSLKVTPNSRELLSRKEETGSTEKRFTKMFKGH